MELGVVIGKSGRDISEDQADSYVAGYGLHFQTKYEFRERLYSLISPRNRYDSKECSRPGEEERAALVRSQRF